MTCQPLDPPTIQVMTMWSCKYWYTKKSARQNFCLFRPRNIIMSLPNQVLHGSTLDLVQHGTATGVAIAMVIESSAAFHAH